MRTVLQPRRELAEIPLPRIAHDAFRPYPEPRRERVVAVADDSCALVGPHAVSQTETCFVLSLVNGLALPAAPALAQRIPASRAIRSSSAGETSRNGIEIRCQLPSTSVKWCETSRCVSASYSSTPTCVSLRSKTLEPLGRPHADLDDEAAARLEVRRRVLEARDLGLLRRLVVDRC